MIRNWRWRREKERHCLHQHSSKVFLTYFLFCSGQHSNATINEILIKLINASKMTRKIEKKFINLVGDSLSLLLFGPLSWVLKLRWNKSLARDLVLTSGDFSECSDSEFSCSELTDRPLQMEEHARSSSFESRFLHLIEKSSWDE